MLKLTGSGTGEVVLEEAVSYHHGEVGEVAYWVEGVSYLLAVLPCVVVASFLMEVLAYLGEVLSLELGL